MKKWIPIFDSELVFDNQKKADKVSITVCLSTYNVSSMVTNALAAIWRQKYTDFEVVVSDDCSPDDTVEVVKKFLESHPLHVPVRFYRSLRNHGIVENRLRGLSYATGEWRMFADGDDELLPDALQRLSERIARLDPVPSLIKVGSSTSSAGKDIYYPPAEPISNAFSNGSNGFVVSRELFETFIPTWPIDRIIADDPFFARRALMLKGQWVLSEPFYVCSHRSESASGGGVNGEKWIIDRIRRAKALKRDYDFFYNKSIPSNWNVYTDREIRRAELHAIMVDCPLIMWAYLWIVMWFLMPTAAINALKMRIKLIRYGNVDATWKH